MKTFAFFDAKPYDKTWFNREAERYGFALKYFEDKLTAHTAILAKGTDGVIAFVNDTIDKAAIDALYGYGIRIIALRSAGYNNVDLESAFEKIHVVRVPAYSPNAVAEYAMALLLALSRKTHKAYDRTREHNFSINGLVGFNLSGKTIGVVGTGKIGKLFIEICRGFGMNIIAYDPYPDQNLQVTYATLEQLCRKSDIISLHCPLTKDTYHIINRSTINLMKDTVVLINTSRGALIESRALLDALKERKIAGAALDVYEEEENVFFEDISNEIMSDDTLSMLITLPNVLVTSHQAFLTDEALANIADTTLQNLQDYFEHNVLKNEICYLCSASDTCAKDHRKNCF